MRSGDILARSTRLTRIQHLLHQNPRGLTARELANLCCVCVRTLQRDLLSLQDELKIPLTQEGDRYGIINSYILPPVSFSLYEAMVLFLASRLVLHQIDENNPHIRAALDKIATALPPQLGKRMKQAVKYIEMKPPNPDFIAIFEQVAIAWSTQCRMRILYRSLNSQKTKLWLLEPYFVEMTGVGYSTYVIGHARRKGKEGLITFKLDRITEAELLEDNFEIPEGLNLDKLLGSAWGVMWGEETEVKLKFSPQVARRVKESSWHPTQEIEDLPDGGCLLMLKVGSTLEMTPWIRGWGADVEVLEPLSLRQDFKNWSDKLHTMYRVNP